MTFLTLAVLFDMTLPDALSSSNHQISTTPSHEIPSGNGKSQPWIQEWPPRKPDLAGVVETRGQILLLDGTGGSGTIAVPNAVTLLPKTKGWGKS